MREKILNYIEKNSRVELKELAVLLGTTEAEITQELADMEAEGIICGYHTLIDWDKVTTDRVNALIEVKVTPQRDLGFDAIAERIYKYPEVNATYLMAGEFDLLVSLEGKTLREVSSFVTQKLATLEYVISTTTHFVLKKYKDHGTILNAENTDERMLMTP